MQRSDLTAVCCLISPLDLLMENMMSQTVDPKLLEILVCPVTHGLLRYDASRQELISDQARLAYPVRDGIPIMLPDEARVLNDHEVKNEQ